MLSRGNFGVSLNDYIEWGEIGIAAKMLATLRLL